jgi:NAD(P)-dependent dehydrogenase (short-subunit alcohol dehydrogenase family)
MPPSTATSANQANERTLVTRILITGSAQGLGRAAATTLLDDGHQVVVHARDTNRAAALTDLVDRGAALVVGDLGSAQQTVHLADQVNQLGRMDAVIHNTGVYGDRRAG